MPLMPVDKCIADTGLLAEVLLQNYEYHVPFCRRIQQYRHLGMKGLTESTPDGWFRKMVELPEPLYEVLRQEFFPVTTYRRTKPPYRSSTGKSTGPTRNTCGW